MNDWYEATGPKRNINDVNATAFSVMNYRKSRVLATRRATPVRPREMDPYYCATVHDRKHWPLHGSYAREGERIMRADNCVYCAARIISLHTGREWDDWRTVASVRPSMIIEELPF